MVEKKAWYKSRTIWTVILSFVYGILPFVGVEVEGSLQVAVSGLIFGILRSVTGVSIGLEDVKK